MCGIAGKISFTSKPVRSQELSKMAQAITHRGPDDEGFYISPDQKVGLAHRRLSIIDLSNRGHQPLRYLNRYQIVFNGEIYNFQEHRHKLAQIGYTFTSRTDTEVITALYDKYGHDCVNHLDGMFAFAIYDEQTKTLFCARDRLGKKPFKYLHTGQVFMFSSELKAILTQSEYHRKPDYHAIYHYLTLQYTPAPLTGFQDIYKLEPAHYIILNTQTGQLTKKRYWSIDYTRQASFSNDVWKEKITLALKTAVHKRLIADVPVGAFLSGGIDSSLIVAFMSEYSSKKVPTFSIGFQEKSQNELPFAAAVSQKYQTDHHELIIKPNAISILPDLIRHYEEPYADSSALPTWYLSQFTRQHVTVALTGDGGDENFLGYTRYHALQAALWLQNIPYPQIPITAAGILEKIWPSTLTERVRRFFESLSYPWPERLPAYTSYFTEELKHQTYRSQNLPNLNTYHLLANITRQIPAHTPLEKYVGTDIYTWLAEDLLPKVDIATMAFGLEARSPFLDHHLLELTAQIPLRQKFSLFGPGKPLLRQIAQTYLPDTVLRRHKHGFTIPISNWFRQDLSNYTHQMLCSRQSRLAEFIEPKKIEYLLANHLSTRNNQGHRLWALLTLEHWLREFF